MENNNAEFAEKSNDNLFQSFGLFPDFPKQNRLNGFLSPYFNNPEYQATLTPPPSLDFIDLAHNFVEESFSYYQPVNNNKNDYESPEKIEDLFSLSPHECETWQRSIPVQDEGSFPEIGNNLIPRFPLIATQSQISVNNLSTLFLANQNINNEIMAVHWALEHPEEERNYN